MRVFISARFFSFFLLLLRRVSARVRLFLLHTLSFRISRKKESRVRTRGTRGPRISETELRLFGGTPTFLLGLFSRLPRIYIADDLATGAQSAAIDCILGQDPQVWVPHGAPPLAVDLAWADVAPEPSRLG